MTNPVTQAKLWYWQRLSAMALAFFVLVHLATMVYAVRGGLSAAEILARTRGSWLLGAFYAAFVIAAALHAAIGLGGIAREWLGVGDRGARFAETAFALLLLVLGLRAVYGVILG